MTLLQMMQRMGVLRVNNKETSMLESAGSAVPKVRRQFDKISKGAGAIGNATGAGVVSDPVVNVSVSLDGTLTSDAGGVGVQVRSAASKHLHWKVRALRSQR